MYECIRLDFKTKPDTFTQFFQTLIPDEYLPCAVEETKYFTPIVIGASLDGVPVGILIAVYHFVLKLADVKYLFVVEAHRNKHIGRRLLAQLESEVKPATVIKLTYPSNQPESVAVDKILAANQWQGTRPLVTRCFFDPFTFNAPWIHNKTSYPKGIKEFMWKRLTQKERDDLVHRKQQEEFFPSVSPLIDEPRIEPLNSLGLRKGKRIIGWMITHRIDPDTIRYGSLYIEYEYRLTGIAIQLLASAIRKHVDSPTPSAVIDIPLQQATPTWIRFVNKRLVPYATRVVHIREAWKQVKPETR